MEHNEPKQLPYQDNFEFYHNMLRILVIVLYTPLVVFMLIDASGIREFLNSFGDWPEKRYFFFFAPLAISLIDMHLVGLEKKSKIPMQKVSRNFIYGSWIVSSLLYSILILSYFFS